MPATFARVPWYAKGYRADQVDAFLVRAEAGELGADHVRTVGFDLVRGGYDVQGVDAELDSLEDKLGRDERRTVRGRLGEQAFVAQVTTQAQALRARLAREHGDRFARVSGLGAGYDVTDVDELCDRIGDYLDGEHALSVEALRAAVFRIRRGSRAYSEQPVDAFLDRVVAVMTKVS